MSVNVSPTAAREIHRIILENELDPAKVCLRVGVKGGGCSGFSYLLDLTETKKDSDEMWEVSIDTPEKSAANEGGGGVAVANATKSITVRVICDPKSYLYLNGTTIDFKDELMGRGFVFNNPNATSSCGCGSSFSA
jgi:iron-sulfur cluster assembly protein